MPELPRKHIAATLGTSATNLNLRIYLFMRQKEEIDQWKLKEEAAIARALAAEARAQIREEAKGWFQQL